MEHPEDGRRYWTYVYEVNPAHVSAAQQEAERQARWQARQKQLQDEMDLAIDAKFRRPEDPPDLRYFVSGGFDFHPGWGEHLAQARHRVAQRAQEEYVVPLAQGGNEQ